MTPERWRQITNIFHASLARGEGDREAFVADACRDDSELRIEIDALLSAHRRAERSGTAPVVVDELPLAPGTRFGACRIERLLGEGGMGRVYLARDTELRRDVAIKVLPSLMADDPAWLERLEREARALAALNHPNIATLYSVERADGRRGLLLEFIDGPTLAEVIDDRRLSLEEVLHIARQLADALESAHERGIVHRDIKPPNLKLTKDRVLKVLDFGLAKNLVAPTPGEQVASVTIEGSIVGTAAYMSPEQARGQAVDRRADIWAFGCVLFEMLTGREVFSGTTHSDTMAAVLEREPAWDQLPASTPEGVRRLLRRCLAKDPKRRLRDIGDAALDLEDARLVPTARHASRRSRVAHAALWIAGVAAIGTAAAFASWYWRGGNQASAALPIRFNVMPEQGAPVGLPALSPDGRRLAFVSVLDGVQTLWVRSLGSLEAQRVAASEGARFASWSPDGRSLAFGAGGRMMKIADMTGSGTVRTAPGVVSAPYGAMWTPDGRIVTGSLTRGGLFADSLDGSAPTKQVTGYDLAHGEGGQLFPTLLPDGRHFLYLSEPSSTIWIASLDSSEKHRLINADSQALYAPPGYLLFVRRQTLFAQRFDPDRLELSGEPVAIAEGVLTEQGYGADFTASSSGAIAYRTGTVNDRTQLKWVDRTGRQLDVLGPPGRYGNIELSPDGTRVVMEAFDAQTHQKDIWTMDTGRGVLTQLTFDSSNETFPIWSPDGRWIMFGSDRHGGWQLYRRRADGLGSEERVATTTESLVPQSWAPDGHSVVYLQRPANLGVLQLEPPSTARLIDNARFEGFGRLDGYGQVSPDGRWLLYGSNESSQWEVYLRRFRERDAGKWKISATGAVSPRWRPDGLEIFYYSGADDRIYGVPITTGATPVIGAPTPLFKARLLGGTTPAILWRMQYAVSHDGQRLLLNELLESSDTQAPITVDTNWMASLKR